MMPRRVLVGLLIACGYLQAQTHPTLQEGDRAPAFSLTTDQGKRISPTTPGVRILVLNFWETDCAPCVAELPSLTAFARKFRPQGVLVLAVSGDEDAQEYSYFLRDHRIALETYRDPARRISRSFGTLLFPESFVIQNGMIIRKVVGAIDWTADDVSSFVQKRLER